MRLLITASGIQDYIFNINHQAASKRLRGRSAQLGLVIDRCLEVLNNEYPTQITLRRNAGSRLDLEFDKIPDNFPHFIENLQRLLDRYSLEELCGQVWFVIAHSALNDKAHQVLGEKKLRVGQTHLQAIKPGSNPTWQEDRFVLPANTEREMTKEDAGKRPEARLGQKLARRENKYIWFTTEASNEGEIKVLDRWVDAGERPPQQGPALALNDAAHSRPGLTRKRLARYAPLCKNGQICDFDEIAERSTGAKFLGVLKADVDNLGRAFSSFPQNAEGEKRAMRLSDSLEELFTEQLEGLLKKSFADCYIVYSGGDDLFMLGPWDQLIRFADTLHDLLDSSVKRWGYPKLSLSAGFRLAHPKSPVRHLADDTEVALEQAKGNLSAPSKIDSKNRICIFERILAWSELHAGLAWADQFMTGIREQGLSTGFLQRLQWYASQFRCYESGKIDGLRMAPLLQNDWRRNKTRLDEKFQIKMESLIGLLLCPMDAEAPARWREIDFAARFALYAMRQKGESQNG